MAVSEFERHRLYGKLEQVLGEEAPTMIDMLSDHRFVTPEYLDLRLDAFEQKIRAEIHAQTRVIIASQIGTIVTITGCLLAVARFA